MLPFLGPLIGTAAKAIDSIFTNDEERLKARAELQKLENDLGKAILEHEKTLIEAQKGVLQAELKSGSWLARNWRPMLMTVFILMLAYNYLVLPICEFAFTALHINMWVPSREEMPEQVWSLLQVGIGGYIVGRSGEKIAKSLGAKK